MSMFAPVVFDNVPAVKGEDVHIYRRKIDINASPNISADVANVPVLIKFNSTDHADLFDNGEDGDSVKFTSDEAGTTQLAHECVRFGEDDAIFYVKVDLDNDSQYTTIYFFYGTPSITGTESASSVWTNGKAIYHLENNANDSMGSYNGSVYGATYNPSGKIGGCYNFDGSNDYIDLNDVDLPSTFTILTWVDPDTTSSLKHILHKTSSNGASTNCNYKLYTYDSKLYSGGSTGGAESSSSTSVSTGWQFVGATYNGTAIQTILNGVADGNPANTATASTNYDASIGRPGERSDYYFDGDIDEMWLFNDTKSADWIASTYNNVANYSTFVTIDGAVNVGNSAPNKPTLVSPTNSGTDYNTTPNFDWNVSTGGTSPYTYELMVDDALSFDSLRINQTGLTDSNFTCTPALATDTLYYWKVRAKDACATYSAWSDVYSFSTIGLIAPSLVSPSNGATSVSIKPDFDWGASTGGTAPLTYEIKVDDNILFTSPNVDVTSISDSNYSYTTGLTPATTYYWKVRALDAGSAYSDWATTQSFTTAPFVAPTFTMPTSGMSITTVTPTFSWSASTGGSGTYTYELMVSLNSGFTTTVVNQTGIATTSYAMTSNLTPDIHYAKLRALDSLGNYSDWTSTISFTAVAPSSSSASSSTSTQEEYVPYTAPVTTNNDTVTTTSTGGSTSVLNKYIFNPVKVIFIDPLLALWNYIVGLFHFSGQDEIIDIMKTPVGVDEYRLPLGVILAGALILLLSFGDGIKMPKFKLGKRKRRKGKR
jgi:hypothetical protein